MHYQSPLDFPLDVDPGAYLGSLAVDACRVAESVRAQGFSSFERLARHVQALPLRPTVPGGDPMAVLREGGGSSTDKHRLLAVVAQGCGHYEVMLTVGVYAMDAANTPGVGPVLAAASLASMPQTRCYLCVDHTRFDFSGSPRGQPSPFAALSAECFVSPDALAEREAHLQRQALAAWAAGQGLTEQAAWALQQACAAAVQAAAAR